MKYYLFLNTITNDFVIVSEELAETFKTAFTDMGFPPTLIAVNSDINVLKNRTQNS